MPLIIPPGFGQVVVQLALAGDSEPIVWTHGVQFDGAPDFQILVDAIDLAWKLPAGLRGQVSSSYSFVGCTLYVGQDGGPPAIYESTGAASPGLGAGAPLPQNCAVLITKRSALAGRRNRGRIYVPGIGEGAVDAAGVVAGATVTAFQTAINLNQTTLLGTTGVADTVILHSTGETSVPPPTVITQWVVENRIATQRARLRK